MKPRHWFNLILISLTAGAIAFFALRWAVNSYADPTCKRYVESKGHVYVGYITPDPAAGTGTSHMSRDGECQFRTASGELQNVGLVAASGSPLGAPILVELAVNWLYVFGGSFIGVALLLAMFYRTFFPGMEKA